MQRVSNYIFKPSPLIENFSFITALLLHFHSTCTAYFEALPSIRLHQLYYLVMRKILLFFGLKLYGFLLSDMAKSK